jgi:hypothetical protein
VSIKKTAGFLAAMAVVLALLFAFSMPALADEAPASATPDAAAAATPAASGVKGTISGTVQNLTAGGSSVAGTDVNLLIYKGQDQSDKQTTKAGQDGKFSFQGLETGTDYTYLLHVPFQGADYAAEPINFPKDSTTQESDVQVFDPTTDDKVVSSPARHYLLEPDQDGIIVSEILIVTNNSDKTYVGSKEVQPGLKETVRFFVPDGAQDVQYGGGMMEGRVFPVDGGMVDTWPVYPGDSQRVLQFRIPAKGDAASFTTKLPMDTEKVNVLTPDAGMGVSVTNVPNKSNPEIQGEKYLLFSGDKIAGGTEIQIKVDHISKAAAASGAAGGASAPQETQTLPLVAGGVIVVLAIVAAALIVRRRRSRPARAYRGTRASGSAGIDTAADADADETGEPEESADEREDRELDGEKRQLMAVIAQLDDSYENQKIGSEEYSRLRAEKKARLIEVIDRQKALAAARGDQ